MPYTEFTPEKGAAFEAAEAAEAAMLSQAKAEEEKELQRKLQLQAKEAEPVPEAPVTALHGPDTQPVQNSAPVSASRPGAFTGSEIMAAQTDAKARGIVEKYGFNLRGLQVWLCTVAAGSAVAAVVQPCHEAFRR